MLPAFAAWSRFCGWRLGGFAPERHFGKVFLLTALFVQLPIMRDVQELSSNNGVLKKKIHPSQAAFLMRKHAPSTEPKEVQVLKLQGLIQ